MSYNYCAIKQNGVASLSSRNTMNDCRSSVVCPKPRRVGLRHQYEVSDAINGSDLLEIILSKGDQAAERSSTHVTSSPPFFCGSPPSRVSNPLIQDARFIELKQIIPQFPSPSLVPVSSTSASSPNSSVRKGGCVRANFGNNPAIRVEGFDCLDRDRRNHGILALA
ncbi:hypothetical protein RND81_02G194200 [Saponaria officinalis]|uniref:Uncharacterized protein n=1 Tax=Saponaria officinalis TaxID=3572 RepID=A0AAW1MN82_SAPOF